MSTMTTHKNSILNPDVVIEWAAEDNRFASRINDRAQRAEALLPNVAEYFPAELGRAKEAVALWKVFAS